MQRSNELELLNLKYLNTSFIAFQLFLSTFLIAQNTVHVPSNSVPNLATLECLNVSPITANAEWVVIPNALRKD